VERAFAVGGAWRDPEIDDSILETVLTDLGARLDAEPEARIGLGMTPIARGTSPRVRRVLRWAWALLGLSPVAAAPERRPLPGSLELIQRARREVASGALGARDPRLTVLAAAALAWTAPEGELTRARELLRRASRHVVEIGDDRWLSLEHGALESTALLAMAEVATGARSRAFRSLSTLRRWEEHGNPTSGSTRALARAAARHLVRGRPPGSAVVTVDGVRREVAIERGVARIDAPALSHAGRHVIEVSVPRGAPLFVDARARFRVPWARASEERGPFALSLEGEVVGLDETSELQVVVRNRSPRTIRQPIIEVELPTGAELSAARARQMGVRWTRSSTFLTLHLPPMRPGNERTLPLPLRWSVAGRLRGLGVSGRAEDRPAAVTTLPPRVLEIEEVSR